MPPPCAVKMKRELFQVSDKECGSGRGAEVAVHDMRPGSAQRWTFTVRDYTKDDRSSCYLYDTGAARGAQGGGGAAAAAAGPPAAWRVLRTEPLPAAC